MHPNLIRSGKILFILFCLIKSPTQAQEIRVLDESTGAPIPDVALFNQARTKAVISNQAGKADISDFSNTDSIYFQHPSYKRFVILKADIHEWDFLIGLEKYVRMLDEFVIAANKWKQEKKEVPNKIKVLNRKEVEFYNPQTTADLLGISNTVFVQKSQLGGGSPMIRGFSANSVLLVIDGVRMNNAIYRSGNLQNVINLDPHMIQETDVIYGPGSVVYGSDAMGGVMSFSTLNSDLSLDDKPLFTANAMTRYATANNEKTGHFRFHLGFRKWAFLSGLTFSDFDDLKMGVIGHPSYRRSEYVQRVGGADSVMVNPDPNVQKFSGYHQWNFTQKVRYRASEYLNFNYSFFYTTSSDIPRYDRLIQYRDNELRYAQWYYGPQKWMMHHASMVYEKATLVSDDLQAVFAYQNLEESRHDRKLESPELTHRTELIDVYSLNIDLKKALSDSWTLYYGSEMTFNNVSSRAYRENIETEEEFPESTRYPDGTNHYFTLAFYGSGKYHLNDKFIINTGLRYNYIQLKSTIEDNSFFNFPFSRISMANGALNGSLGWTYLPYDKAQLKMNLSTGFRAPNLDDAAKVFDSEPGRVIVPNEDLDPEYSYNLDLSWIQSINEFVQFEITGFYTHVRNIMVRRTYSFEGQDSIFYDGVQSEVYALANASKANIYGVSLNVEAHLSSALSLESDFTIIKGKDSDQNTLRHVPPLYGGFHIKWNQKKWNADLYLLYNGKIPADKLTPEEQSKTHMYELNDEGRPYSPAWYTVNLKFSFQPTGMLLIQSGVENILNHRYRPYASGIVAPGRNFYVALRLSLG
jgi:hemoglobin/transferrin/lactoferrin receptor protein